MAVFFASWSVAALGSLHSAAERVTAGSFVQASRPMQSQLRETSRHEQTARAMLVAPVEKSTRLATVTRTKPKVVPAAQPPADPFGKVIAEAKLSREKLHAAFTRAGMAISNAEQSVEVALAVPIAERFHRLTDSALPSSDRLAPQPMHAATDVAPASLSVNGAEIQLAYASVETGADDPVQLALASLGDDPLGMDAEVEDDGEVMPEAVIVPPGKPETVPQQANKPDAEPETGKPLRTAKPKPEPEAKPQRELAYARPDKPAIGAFKNLFNAPKAGKGVAIYDISAAVVHMPDGTKLEAHSGIGKMADNPRYVHVKMNGPTPPNTYKLSMREKRFHGVEAIRMTPIGGQTMHGRDGMLAHSYLLRGGREESHGCVAFANYPKFLKAFKQGKVTHIVVVPSMSRMPKIRMASTGRGA